jgi:hypothetical protein
MNTKVEGDFITMLGERMTASSDLLWWVNNEYRKRLTKVETYLDLLEQLLLAREPYTLDGQSATIGTLHYVQEQISSLSEEHRGWRYAYYYESANNKRMVHSESEINRALAYFSRMRSRHERAVLALYDALSTTPRPDPDLTNVANGDLWLMMQYAIDELTEFIGQPGSHVS